MAAGGRVGLRLNLRRVLQHLGMVYSEPLEFLRELIQNAIDAHASRMDIEVYPSKSLLVFRHNGEPITGEYLRAFLTVGTEYKARRSGYIGMYGIGRLAWIMVGDRAEILTDGHEILWDAHDLEHVVIRPSSGYLHGVEWRIHLRREAVNELEPFRVRNYLREVYWGSIPVYVNGRPVRHGGGLVELYSDKRNKVYLNKANPYSGVIVKGVFRVGDDYSLPGLLVYTSDPRVRINPARHVVRDEAYKEWRRDIARRALRAIKEKYTAGEAYTMIGPRILEKLVETAYGDEDLDWLYRQGGLSGEELRRYKRLLRERIAHLVFRVAGDGYVYGSEILKKPGKWLYSRLELDDTSLKELESRGIHVVYLDNYGDEVAEWLRTLGVRSTEEYRVEKKARKTRVSGSVARKLGEALKIINRLIRRPPATYPETRPGHAKVSMPGGREAEAQARATPGGGLVLEYTYTRPGSPAPRKNVVRAKIIGRLENPVAPIYIVKADDKDMLAFEMAGRIYINASNPEVQRLLEATKRFRDEKKIVLLWAPIILHELAHVYGLDHTDREWHEFYEAGIRRIIEWYLGIGEEEGP